MKLKFKDLLIEIEFFCLHCNIFESIVSYSIEKASLPSCFEIRSESSFRYNKEIERMGRTFPTV